jgi:hypothetical protein
MKKFEKDTDFLDLVAAWHENRTISPSRRKELLQRLREDQELRIELAREIEMAGLTRAAQAGEPRWLELEEKLGDVSGLNNPDFEKEVMDKLSEPTPKDSSKISFFPKLAWLGVAAAVVLLFLNLQDQIPNDPGVAQVMRLEGENLVFKQKQVLQKGEEFIIEQGLVEMAFRETGVNLVGTGPLNMTLVSNDRVFLKEGEIKLVVPPQGIGFVVDTMERKFVDLGTSFVVQANQQGSKILVLDGEVAVGARDDSPSKLMSKGSMADFDRDGKMKLRGEKESGVPELSVPPMIQTDFSLNGNIFGIKKESEPRPKGKDGVQELTITKRFLPLIKSGFKNQNKLGQFVLGRPLRFSGIAGSYNHFPENVSLDSYSTIHGWMAWYSGKVKAPEPGKYRFWGYADNNLLVSINGKAVFEGSRSDSHFRNELKVFRNNHPSFPCLNSRSGFARGKWITIGEKPVQIDLLFGERSENLTSGILLIEKEGVPYDKTYWGQPMWPLFLTEFPSDAQLTELDQLRMHMEENIKGSFSVSEDAVWKVTSGS